jgi:hypothetical protein
MNQIVRTPRHTRSAVGARSASRQDRAGAATRRPHHRAARRPGHDLASACSAPERHLATTNGRRVLTPRRSNGDPTKPGNDCTGGTARSLKRRLIRAATAYEGGIAA